MKISKLPNPRSQIGHKQKPWRLWRALVWLVARPDGEPIPSVVVLFASEERGTDAPSPSSSTSTSSLSLVIDPSCTIDLITICGLVRLFYIDLKNFFIMFTIVDLIMCE
jgi:hypothetical protein